MTPATIPVTFFSDYRAQLKREDELSPQKLAVMVSEMVAAEKARLPWLKLARFGFVRSSKNSLRHDGNVLCITGVEGDYDLEKVHFDTAVEIAKAAGLCCLIYTSPSHTPGTPRWRILCFLSRELPPTEHYRLVARLNGLYGGIFSTESFTLSQSYYYGRIVGCEEYKVELIDGTPLDLLEGITEIGKPNGSGGPADDGTFTARGPFDEAAIAAEIVSGARYHSACLQLLGRWAYEGVPYLDALRRLYAIFEQVPEAERNQRWRIRYDDIVRCLNDIYGAEAAKADDAAEAAAAADSSALFVDADAWTETALPQRPWVAPGYALRGAVTVVVGPPSAMKSSLMLGWACATALGLCHGPFAPVSVARVLIYNTEDDTLEQRRRLSAVLRQFNATPADIEGRVIRAGPPGVGTLFVLDDRGRAWPTAAMMQLRQLIQDHQPAMLIADPFAELHSADENSNTEVRTVIAAFRALAAEFNIAVVLVHHTRKGGVAPGDPDSARGASAIIGAARIVQTLIGMSEEDAETLGMPTSRRQRSYFVRLDDAKQNYAGIGDAVWFEKKLYLIGNGELIPAAEPWVPPDVWAALTPQVANAILDDIAAGIDSEKGKQYYTDASALTERSASSVVRKRLPSLSDKQARAIVKTWVENGVLYRKQYDDPVSRKERNGLFINDINRPGSRAAR